jgi:L-ascorbate metabolism protein UlaG (beta-lactamase superfamily)
MQIKLEFLGHSGFWITDGRYRVLIDPFLSRNPLAKKKPTEIKCDWIVLTHGHSDHSGDAEEIAKQNGATIHAIYELADVFGEKGCKVSHGNQGGRVTTEFGSITLVHAFHSSSIEGRYAGMPCGIILEIGGVTIYHCGDTGLFGDMALIGEMFRPQIAMIPIGDRYTMGPRLASKAAELIQPKIAIPIHFNTFPDELVNDAGEFQPKGIEIRVMEPGDTLTYPDLPLICTG